MDNELWTDVYKPINVQGLIGRNNKIQYQKIVKWLEDWEAIHILKTKPKPIYQKFGDNLGAKVVVLSGPPGIGKSTMIHLIKQQFGYHMIEINSSEEKSKQIMERYLLQNHIQTISFSNKKKIYIMEEIDGFSSTDRGSTSLLLKWIKELNYPMICTCNDIYHSSLKSILHYCLDIRLVRPDKREIKTHLLHILSIESQKREVNNEIDEAYIDDLLISNGNDIRNSIHTLQLWVTTGYHERNEKDDVLKYNHFEITKKMFSSDVDFQQKYEYFFQDYHMIPLYVHENVTQHSNLENIASSLSDLSFQDTIQNKIMRENDWNLLPISASFTISASITSSKRLNQVEFPKMLGKISTQNKKKRYLEELRENYHDIYYKNRMIMSPFVYKQENSVRKSIEYLDKIKVSRDDYLEKYQDFVMNDSFKYDSLETKIKTNYTKEYNKTHQKTKTTKKKDMIEMNLIDSDSDSHDESHETMNIDL